MRRKPKPKWSRLAQEDLKRLRKWIANRGAPRTARSFVSRLRRYVETLRDFPEIGAVVEEFNNPAFREIVFQDQRIFYHYDGAMIKVLTVFHGSHTPDLPRLLGE